jgi:hypothetical protein
LTVKDAILYVAALSDGKDVPSEATIRQWLARGRIRRDASGIDPHSIEEWWRYDRNHHQGNRRKGKHQVA